MQQKSELVVAIAAGLAGFRRADGFALARVATGQAARGIAAQQVVDELLNLCGGVGRDDPCGLVKKAPRSISAGPLPSP